MPPVVCTICGSPMRKRIDAAIFSGMSMREIEAQFGFKRASVHRHAKNHLGNAVGMPANTTAGAQANELASRRSWARLYRKAEAKGDLSTMAKAQAALDKMNVRASLSQPQPRLDEAEMQSAHVRSVRRALGFWDDSEKSHQLRDSELVMQLRAACQRYSTNELFLAAAARMMSILTRQTLPPALEIQVAQIEGGDDGLEGSSELDFPDTDEAEGDGAEPGDGNDGNVDE